MGHPNRREILKEDSFGRVVRLRGDGEDRILREAFGSWLPLTGWIARMLCRRERRALQVLEGLTGVPRLDPKDSGHGKELLRNHLPGAPLSKTTFLPRDYFDHLDALVAKVHGHGVCHNDLHKEQNIMVLPDGRPALLDFQLASVHGMGGWGFKSRCAEDLRHLQLSLKRQGEVIQVEPAVCRKCGFVCSAEKMTKPSRCPECKQTRLQEPLVWIEVKGD